MFRYNTITISCLLILAASCGKERKLDLGEFAPYVAKFEAVSAQNGSPVAVEALSIHMGKTSKPTEMGICELTEGQVPTITINEDAWQAMTDAERESLVFHEMGHCVLGRVHDDAYMDSAEEKAEIPASLMNTYTLDGQVYEKHQIYYHKELFTNR